MPQISIPVQVEPDADGIIDGRDLARQLIEVAFTAIVPYVNGCHACADNLFSAIANGILAELHEQGHITGQLDGMVYRPGLPFDEAALDRHFEAASAETRALLGGGDDTGHRH